MWLFLLCCFHIRFMRFMANKCKTISISDLKVNLSFHIPWIWKDSWSCIRWEQLCQLIVQPSVFPKPVEINNHTEFGNGNFNLSLQSVINTAARIIFLKYKKFHCSNLSGRSSSPYSVLQCSTWSVNFSNSASQQSPSCTPLFIRLPLPCMHTHLLLVFSLIPLSGMLLPQVTTWLTSALSSGLYSNVSLKESP